MIKRKKTVILTVTLALLAIVIFLAVLLVINMNGKCFTRGRCVVSSSGSVVWVDESGVPVVLSNRIGNEDIFKDLSTGDEILFLRQTAIATSYPGQVGIYYCKKLSDGSADDIPIKTLGELCELGWIDVDIDLGVRCFSRGRCVVAKSGSVLWIDKTGSPVVLSNRTDNKDMFKDLSTGDEIFFLRDSAIAESYPGQVGAYYCKKISDGSESDIPESTLDSLRQLGWLD